MPFWKLPNRQHVYSNEHKLEDVCMCACACVCANIMAEQKWKVIKRLTSLIWIGCCKWIETSSSSAVQATALAICMHNWIVILWFFNTIQFGYMAVAFAAAVVFQFLILHCQNWLHRSKRQNHNNIKHDNNNDDGIQHGIAHAHIFCVHYNMGYVGSFTACCNFQQNRNEINRKEIRFIRLY